MGKISATLKVTEKRNWIYWLSKPANRYELTYHSEADNQPHTIYNASLRNVFREFFIKNGTFTERYELKVDPTLTSDQQVKIQKKFDNEREHFTRRLLGLGENQPLPQGEALDVALKKALEDRKISLKRAMEQQSQREYKHSKIFAGISTLSLVGLGILVVLVASATVPLLSMFVPIMLLGGMLIATAFTGVMCFSLYKTLVRDTEAIDHMDNPFSLTSKHALNDYDPFHAKPTYQTETGQLPHPIRDTLSQSLETDPQSISSNRIGKP